MKYIITPFLCLLFFNASAQIWWPYVNISFDGYDSVRRSDHTAYATDLVKWITIDTVHYHHNIWQIGKPQKTAFDSAHSYPNVIVTDTANPCVANDTSVFVLKFPRHMPLQLRSLLFSYKLDLDTGDRAIMEFSSDGGTTWVDILHDTTHSVTFLTTMPDLSRSHTNWDTVSFVTNSSLTYTRPDSFLLKFSFITGDSTTPRNGWMIDDFDISYQWEGVSQLESEKYFTIYPNPVNDKLVISYNLPAPSDAYFRLSDMYGRIVLLQQLKHVQTGEVILNISNIPAGVYECTMEAGNETITRTVIVRH